ncbi:MAG TPA: cysteine dioxygenase family protein [Candidatus Polarisedimenticolia bacterium]|nr:cysteine dioxygenase family protein [Candidatus Polarisedimenticolia bacterium]
MQHDPRIRAFLADLETLVGRGEAIPKTVQDVKERLTSLLAQRPLLPDQVRRTSGNCYARHLLHQDPQGRFEVVVMTWSPGQQTPVHDHSGIWCVEGVCEGVVDVTRYNLLEMVRADVARMEPSEVIHAGLGQCGALIPPVEYHRISNPYADLALTLHVYGGRMRSCRVFLEAEGDLYKVSEKPLEFASTAAAV